MPGPFDSNAFDHALGVFYDTPVAFCGTRSGARPVALTVKCCIFDGGFAEPILDDAADSSVRTVVIAFPLSAWREATPPQIGERVKADGTVFHVAKVERALGDWHLTAKEGEP